MSLQISPGPLRGEQPLETPRPGNEPEDLGSHGANASVRASHARGRSVARLQARAETERRGGFRGVSVGRAAIPGDGEVVQRAVSHRLALVVAAMCWRWGATTGATKIQPPVLLFCTSGNSPFPLAPPKVDLRTPELAAAVRQRGGATGQGGGGGHWPGAKGPGSNGQQVCRSPRDPESARHTLCAPARGVRNVRFQTPPGA